MTCIRFKLLSSFFFSLAQAKKSKLWSCWRLCNLCFKDVYLTAKFAWTSEQFKNIFSVDTKRLSIHFRVWRQTPHEPFADTPTTHSWQRVASVVNTNWFISRGYEASIVGLLSTIPFLEAVYKHVPALQTGIRLDSRSSRITMIKNSYRQRRHAVVFKTYNVFFGKANNFGRSLSSRVRVASVSRIANLILDQL